MAMTGGTPVLLRTSHANYGESFEISLYAYYKITQDAVNKTSTISLGMYVATPKGYTIGRWSDSRGSYIGTSEMTFSGTVPSDTSGTYWLVEDKELEIAHDATGRKTATIEWKWGVNSPWGQMQNPSGSFNITLPPFPVYKLTLSAGDGAVITVNRTSCAGSGALGNLSNNASLWYGDTLRITFSATTNYTLQSYSVNGNSFSSGSYLTVSSNVSVAATARLLVSSLTATNTTLNGATSIAVTRYNENYTHTISYSFGSLSGVICAKDDALSYTWNIPASFAGEITGAKSALCTLTMETFEDNTSLGTSTYAFSIIVPSTYSPDITGSVTDTNSITTSLTGDNSVLVRGKSIGWCEVCATAKSDATIVSLKINGIDIEWTESNGAATGGTAWNGFDNSFVFEATDSRGFVSTTTITPTIIEYIPLTINPTISRPNTLGDTVTLSFSGNVYRGLIGETYNTLSIKYQYRESTENDYGVWQSGSWVNGGWKEVSTSTVRFSGNSYSTQGAIALEDSFDYRKLYDFVLKVTDGANGVVLSTVEKNIIINQGVPVFDWGEHDFHFHVPIIIGNTMLTEQQLISLLALLQDN